MRGCAQADHKKTISGDAQDGAKMLGKRGIPRKYKDFLGWMIDMPGGVSSVFPCESRKK
jgi:hypothetical protein